ncbi:MAG: signal peptidase I [Oscillospiraceae bacterium]|nr:signal peptidase I [Oscillospiraceae bacterium]
MASKTTEKKSVGSSKVLSAVGLVLCIIFGGMLICNLTIIIKGTLYPERPPSVLGITPMVVLSGSMSGEAKDHIEVGDLIFVGKAEPDELEVGDVIAYMEGEVVVTHRIIGIETGGDGKLQFKTKGDANNAEDLHPVLEDNLVGIYKFRIPVVGDFAMFLQTPLGMVLFIGVPMLAFIMYDILRRRRYAEKEEKRTAELEAELARLREMAGKAAEDSAKD